MKRIILISIVVIIAVVMALYLSNRLKTPEKHKQHQQSEAQVLYYTCGMHPSVKVSPESYAKGNKSCPICHMDLVPVYKKGAEHVSEQENIISINPKELALAGIETFKVRVLPLFKEIRTVGVVAYDPALRGAQQEYLQALDTYRQVSQSQFKDARERAKDILEATKVKLKLLGLNDELIKDLEETGKPDDSLILPAKSMWVYADIYEHEALWPQVSDKVKVKSQVDSSVIFEGEIKSIDPVLKERTRTLKLKIRIENKNHILKPNMYVDVYLKSELGPVLSIPKEAVLDMGKRKVIYLEKAKGEFVLREAIVGPLAQGIIKGVKMDFYPLVEGAQEKDSVVSKGNFLIDSQSQLGIAASSYGGALGDKESAAPSQHQH